MRSLLLAGLLLAAPLVGTTQSVLQEPQHRLRSTLEEGTWISLDVSPVGRSIVFELLGDLYLLPLEGGNARSLTRGTAFDSQPRYSPDGKSILFVSDRDGADNLWIVEANGESSRAITHERRTTFISPDWSPDGRRVIVSRSTRILDHSKNYQVFTYDLGAALERDQLTFDSDESPEATPAGSVRASAAVGATYATDARSIYLSMRFASGWSGYGNWQLCRLDPATKRTSRMTFERGSGMRPVVSPDGRYLVYGTRIDGTTALRLMSLDSGDERLLVAAVDLDEQESWSFRRDLMPGAAFTPDGSALVVAYHGRIWKVAVADGAVAPIPFKVETDLGIATLARFNYEMPRGPVEARRIENPSLSPDGRRIAFSALGQLWTQPLGASARHAPSRLETGNDGAFYPAWSPDGAHIAFVSWNDREGGHIWRIRADGGSAAMRLSTRPAFYEKLAYSPDGRELIAMRGPRQQRISYSNEMKYAAGRAQSTELIVLPAAGGEARAISYVNPVPDSEPHAGMPHFGPKAGEAYFTDPVEGLVSVRLDGTGRHVVLDVQGDAWAWNGSAIASEIQISPDGMHAGALVNEQVWLVELDATSGSSVNVTTPGAARRLTAEGADFMRWSTDGRSLIWALGNVMYRKEIVADGGGRVVQQRLGVKMPRATPKGVLALRGARIITMRGREVIESGDLVISGNRIVAVGPRGTVAIPAGAQSMDVSGKTILPGYVDIHSHVSVPRGVHRQQVWEYQANLAYGITTVRDPQTTTWDFISYSDEIATGDILGPRVFSTGRGIFPSDDIASLDDARALTRRNALFYRTETLKDYQIHGDRQVRQWLATAARESRLTPTFESNRDLKTALTRVVDGFGGMEHSPTTTHLYADVLGLLAESGITYTPTLVGGQNTGWNLFPLQFDLHNDDRLNRFWPHAELDEFALLRSLGVIHPALNPTLSLAAQAKQLLDVGGRVGLGSHGNGQGLGTHWLLWLLAEGGVPPHDVLRIATVLSAEAIGHGQDLGSLEPGKLADLQILDGNPLEDIRLTTSIRQVMANGFLYSADTLDEIWPAHRPLEHQWWWESRPRLSPVQ